MLPILLFKVISSLVVDKATDLATEVSRAKTAEGVNATAIATEKNISYKILGSISKFILNVNLTRP